MCKYSLGVHSKTTTVAALGELGRYPIYLDNVVHMVKYWLRLHKSESDLLTDALADNQSFL